MVSRIPPCSCLLLTLLHHPGAGRLKPAVAPPSSFLGYKLPVKDNACGTTHPPSSWTRPVLDTLLAVTLTSTHRCFSPEQGPQFTPLGINKLWYI